MGVQQSFWQILRKFVPEEIEEQGEQGWHF
jgi:hypothetical protein